MAQKETGLLLHEDVVCHVFGLTVVECTRAKFAYLPLPHSRLLTSIVVHGDLPGSLRAKYGPSGFLKRCFPRVGIINFVLTNN
jgi:hypothetical protein